MPHLPVIKACELLNHIENGDPLIYDHVAIAGDIDISRLDMPPSGPSFWMPTSRTPSFEATCNSQRSLFLRKPTFEALSSAKKQPSPPQNSRQMPTSTSSSSWRMRYSGERSLHESVRQDPASSGKNADQDQLVQDPGWHGLDLMRLRRPAQIYRIFELHSDHSLCPSLLDGRRHCCRAAKRRHPQHRPPQENLDFLDNIYFSAMVFTAKTQVKWYPVGVFRYLATIKSILGWLLLAPFLVTLGRTMIL